MFGDRKRRIQNNLLLANRSRFCTCTRSCRCRVDHLVGLGLLQLLGPGQAAAQLVAAGNLGGSPGGPLRFLEDAEEATRPLGCCGEARLRRAR